MEQILSKPDKTVVKYDKRTKKQITIHICYSDDPKEIEEAHKAIYRFIAKEIL